MPSDYLFADPAEKCSLVSLSENIWSNEGLPIGARESPSRIVDVLHDRLQVARFGRRPYPPRRAKLSS